MLKKIVLALVILGLVLGFSGMALAEEKVEFEELRLTAVREEPVDVLRWGGSGLDFLAEALARLIKTGKPSVAFGEEITGALEVTFVDGFLGRNVDLMGGATFANEEPAAFMWGLQYTGLKEKAESGGIWLIFSKLNPSVYNVGGMWYLGAGYEFRAEE